MPRATVKDAVRAVQSYLNEFKDILPAYDIRLEETFFDYDHEQWIITVSFLPEALAGSERTVKQFSVSDDNFNPSVLAMNNPGRFVN